MRLKKLSIVGAILCTLSLVVACSSSTNPTEDIYKQDKEVVKTVEVKEEPKPEPLSLNIVTPAGSPAVSMAQMIKDVPELEDGTVLNFDILASTEALKSKVIAGEADMAIVPTNLASVFYNRDIGYQVAATTVWGNLYLVSSESINDLTAIGEQEVVVFGQGLTPDILLSYLLDEKGIDMSAMNIRYVNAASDVAPLYLTDQAPIVLIPEPMLSKVKTKKDVHILMDLQREWSQVMGDDSSYPQASLIVKKELINDHAEAVNAFLDTYSTSIQWANDNVDMAGQYAEELELGLPKAVVAASIPGSNIMYKDAKDAKSSIHSYLGILFDKAPKTIGGKLPDDGFYYER